MYLIAYQEFSIYLLLALPEAKSNKQKVSNSGGLNVNLCDKPEELTFPPREMNLAWSILRTTNPPAISPGLSVFWPPFPHLRSDIRADCLLSVSVKQS